MSTTFAPIAAFVEGRCDAAAFESSLQHDADLEELLRASPAPRHAHTTNTLFDYLLALNYHHPGDVLSAQDTLARFLTERNVPIQPSKQATEDYRLLLSAQPRWLDVDAAYLQRLMQDAPVTATPTGRKVWLQRRLLECFRCARQPPRWLQSPQWPFGEHGPLVFLGQVAVKGYFHDDAVAYVFHDPPTGTCQTVVQVG